MLSFLVLILELSQAFVREAVLVNEISHGHPAYIYDPLVQCNTSTSADVKNAAGSSACYQGAAIALLVTLVLIGLAPCFWYLLIGLCIFCQQDGTISNTEYSEEHHSPIFLCLISFVHIVKKIICNKSGNSTPNIVSSKASFCTYTLKSLAVPFYLFGKLLEPILLEYGECIGCDRHCVKTWSLISIAALILSFFMFFIFPLLMIIIADWRNWEYKPSKKNRTLRIFSVQLQVLCVYSSIVEVFRSTNYCSVFEQAWWWIYLFITTGVATIVVIVILPEQLFNGNCQIIFFAIVFFPFEFLLLLGSNLQPLDCAFHCDMLLSRTLSKSQIDAYTKKQCCDVRSNAITRLSIMVIVNFSFLTFMICGGTLLYKKLKMTHHQK